MGIGVPFTAIRQIPIYRERYFPRPAPAQAGSLDAVVIAKAQELGAILLSLNGDFADIVTYPPANYLGIVAVQLHNYSEIVPQLMRRLLSFFETHPAQEFYQRKLFLVEVHRVRIRQ